MWNKNTLLLNFFLYREPAPSTFLTASALSVIYKLYSLSSGSLHGDQVGHQLPFVVDARIIQRCLNWLFVQQVSTEMFLCLLDLNSEINLN